MNNDIKTIYDFDYRIIREYFSSVERQGPGSPHVTLQALDFIDNLSDNSSITDIGCGTGGQTQNNELTEIGKELSKFIAHINETEL